MASGRGSVLGQAVWIGLLGVLILLLESLEILNTRLTYAALTILLLLYLWREVARIRRYHPQRWLLNPAIVCAFSTFFMAYGWSNVLFFLPPESLALLGLVPDVSSAMVKHQYLVLGGAIALFLGYWSPVAARLASPGVVARVQRRFLPRTETLRPLAIPVLLALALGARLFAMRQGLYGYGGDYSAERLAVTAGYSQYLALLGSLGKFALVLAALRYFSPGSRISDARWFWAALLIEVFFGFLSGMKGAVVMPIVIAGICLYLRTGKIPRNWIILTLAAVMVAYAVIEPFRVLRNQQGTALSSLGSTLAVLSQAATEGDRRSRQEADSAPVYLSVAARSNLSYIGSFGIDYADAYQDLPADSPAFLEDLYLAPLHALIPRFIWDSKPLGQLGLWYNQVVMGMSHFSSTAMGPFAYLYFAGGYLAVGIGFFVIGVLQRAWWFLTTPWQNLAGATVFLPLLGTLTNVDSAVNGIIINLFRDIPLVLILTHLLLRRAPRREGGLAPVHGLR